MTTSSDTMSVLSVAADPERAEAVATALEGAEERLSVHTVASASAGMDRLAAHDFACLVSVHDPPGHDSFDFLATVREDYPDLPFVLVPNTGSEALVSAGILAGDIEDVHDGIGTDHPTDLATRVTELAAKRRGHSDTDAGGHWRPQEGDPHTQDGARRKQDSEQTAALLATLFETLPVGVVVLNTDGRITRANQHAETILGLTESEITSRTYNDPQWDIIDEDGARVPDDELPFARVMATGETVLNAEHGLERSDGTERWLSINAAPLTDETGAIDRVVTVLTDITGRRSQERAIERQNDRLEQFTSLVSHDLRNPLAVATASLELVRSECDSDQLDDLEHALDRMDRLIEDLLGLARTGDGASALEPVDLEPLVERSWGTVETGDATLVTSVDRTVEADESRLQQLLENLIRNAIEHGGDAVTVTVGGLEDGDGFYVADDGPGIPAEDREEVFDVGFSTATDGTGFGLNIVAQVVTDHGWEISITDSERGGARFEITTVGAGDR